MAPLHAHLPVLVRGTGEIGSAIAVVLFRAGYPVLLHDDAAPTTARRGMTFTDAVFDGSATLEGIQARRIDLARLPDMMVAPDTVLITVAPFGDILAALAWPVLVDGRLRMRSVPEPQKGLAPVTIGVGPNFIAGETVDFAIESCWGDSLGAIIESGSPLPVSSKPQSLHGVGRARFVYSPVAGCLRTSQRIGARVEAGAIVATIGKFALLAPFSGVIRGLTRDGVTVPSGTKVIEIDPKGNAAAAFGLGERPRRVASSVLQIVARSPVPRVNNPVRASP